MHGKQQPRCGRCWRRFSRKEKCPPRFEKGDYLLRCVLRQSTAPRTSTSSFLLLPAATSLKRHTDRADTCRVSTYSTEVAVKKFLEIDSWRNLRKEHVLQLMEMLPEVDPEVAKKLLDQVPELSKMAQAVLDDAAKAYDAALSSNNRSMELVHESHRKALDILQAELARTDLTPEERMSAFAKIDEILANLRLKDTENKQFLAEQLHAKLATAAVAVAGIAAVVFTAIKSGEKPSLQQILGAVSSKN